MHTSACQTRRPAYRHRTITTALSKSTTESVTVNQSPPLTNWFSYADGPFISRRGTHAALYGVTSGHVKRIFRKCQLRHGPVRRTRTSGRYGSRSGDLSCFLITSLFAQVGLLSRIVTCAARRSPVLSIPGNRRVPCRAAPTYSSGLGAVRPFLSVLSMPPSHLLGADPRRIQSRRGPASVKNLLRRQ